MNQRIYILICVIISGIAAIPCGGQAIRSEFGTRLDNMNRVGVGRSGLYSFTRYSTSAETIGSQQYGASGLLSTDLRTSFYRPNYGSSLSPYSGSRNGSAGGLASSDLLPTLKTLPNLSTNALFEYGNSSNRHNRIGYTTTGGSLLENASFTPRKTSASSLQNLLSSDSSRDTRLRSRIRSHFYRLNANVKYNFRARDLFLDSSENSPYRSSLKKMSDKRLGMSGLRSRLNNSGLLTTGASHVRQRSSLFFR